MDAEVYTDPSVAGFITENFIPARAHVKSEQDVFARFNAQWTPTILVLDERGTEQHRIEGFLPAPDFLAQVRLGLAHAARARSDWATAQQHYGELAKQNDDVAAEATYWNGVSKYRATNDPSALGATAEALRSRFPQSAWTKKSSIWAA
ncbi:MAG TPA: thioredoxin family protein [Thermoanaerobaculia bacterium]